MGQIRFDLPKVLNIQRDNVHSALRFSSKRSFDEVSDDFLVQGFFVGNDFLPKIQMFHHIHDGLRFMLEVYGITSKRGTTNFLTVNGKLDINGLKHFVNYFVKEEEKYLIDQITTSDERKQPPSEKYINKTLEKTVYKNAKNVWIMDFDAYKKAYYQKSPENMSIDTMCKDYLLTFVWIYDYYVTGISSWTWRYEYHYAPLMRDFSKYISGIDQNTFEGMYKNEVIKPSLPVLAFEQLIAVLPPASANLLPKEYAEILTNPKSELVKKGFYPAQFERDFEGKLKEHEAHVLLPFMDYKLLHEEYQNIKPAKIYNRNKKTGSYSYKYNKKYKASFISDMGNIPLLHVQKKDI